MRASLVSASGRIACVEAAAPEPGPGQVLVRTRCASLCGSDLHHVYMPLPDQGFPGHAGFPGHEGIGEVVDSRVPNLAAGKLVLTVPGIHDAACFADYQSLAPANLLPLPEAAPAETLVLAQPLGTVIYGLKRFLPGEIPETAVVLGQGSIGLFFTWLLKRRGVARVITSEVEPLRRSLSRDYGADEALDGRGAALVEAARDLTAGHGASLVIEAAGTDETRWQAVELAAEDGFIGLFGLPQGAEMARFPYGEMYRKRVTAASTYSAQDEAGLASFREALSLIADGEIDVGPLITHRVSIEDVERAFDLARRRDDRVVKALLTFD